VPSAPEDVVYGIARIDSSGRICERAIITALDWAGGDRLTFTVGAGVVTARRDPGGMVTLPASGYITMPAALRRGCGLGAGGQVLLAALPGQGSLAAYSLAVVDQAIRAHGSFRDLQGGRP
jgi:bifunctional DNA-binding transcriptional regulator/antitoxin component of YhaV-PrlF toxin-antitoxin module